MSTVLIRDPAGAVIGRLNAPEGADSTMIEAKAREAFTRLRAQVPEAAEAIKQQANPLAQAGPEGPAMLGQAGLEIAKQEALPTALGLGVTALAGPAAGLATRATLAGGAAVGGANITRILRGQPQMTGGEAALEAGLAALPEVPISLLRASTTTKLLEKFARRAGIQGLRPVVNASEIAEAGEATLRASEEVGRRLRTEVPRLRAQLGATRDAKFNAVRTLADKHKLMAVPSERSSAALSETLALVNEELQAATKIQKTGIIDPSTGKEITREIVKADSGELRELAELLTRASTGGRVPYSDLSRIRLLVHDRVPQFSAMLSPGAIKGRNPFIELRNSLSEDLVNTAAGTPVEAAARAANDFLINEFKPTKTALSKLDKSPSPESAVNVLVRSDPGQFRRIMRSLDPQTQNEVRGAFAAGLFTEARDAAGIVNLGQVVAHLDALPAASRRELMRGGEKEYTKILESMQAEMTRMRLAGQFRLPQAITLSVGAGSVGSALASGGIGSALPWLAGTAGGIQVMTRIMSNPGARRLMARGLETQGQAGARFIGQAIDRAIADIAAPESRLPSAQR